MYILEELFYSVQSYSVRTHDKINMKKDKKESINISYEC